MDVQLICTIIFISLEVTSQHDNGHLWNIRHRREMDLDDDDVVSRLLPLYMLGDDEREWRLFRRWYETPNGRYKALNGWYKISRGWYKLSGFWYVMADDISQSKNELYRFYKCIDWSLVTGEACGLHMSALRNDVREPVELILNQCTVRTPVCLWRTLYMRCSHKDSEYFCSMIQLNVNNSARQEKTTLKKDRSRRSNKCGAVCQLMTCVAGLLSRSTDILQCILNIVKTTSTTSGVTTTSPRIRATTARTFYPPFLYMFTDSPTINSSITTEIPAMDTASQSRHTMIAGIVAGLFVIIILCGIVVLVWIKLKWRRRSRCKISSPVGDRRRESDLVYSQLENTRTSPINRPATRRMPRSISNQLYAIADNGMLDTAPYTTCNLPDLLETIPRHLSGTDDTEYNRLGVVLKSNSGSGRIYSKAITPRTRRRISDADYAKLKPTETGLRFSPANRRKGNNSDATAGVYATASNSTVVDYTSTSHVNGDYSVVNRKSKKNGHDYNVTAIPGNKGDYSHTNAVCEGKGANYNTIVASHSKGDYSSSTAERGGDSDTASGTYDVLTTYDNGEEMISYFILEPCVGEYAQVSDVTNRKSIDTSNEYFVLEESKASSNDKQTKY